MRKNWDKEYTLLVFSDSNVVDAFISQGNLKNTL